MKNLIIILLVAFCLGSCKTSTEITGSWKNPDVLMVGDVNTILVTALTARTMARQAMEDELSSALNKQGYKTIKSIDVMPPTLSSGQTVDRSDLLSKINGTGADAILTVALIDEKTETRYIPGNQGYAPITRFGYYGTFWGYYNTWYPTLYSPGYYEEDKVYFLETNLYDAKTEQLLWSAQSESYNPGSLPELADEFAGVVVSRLEDDGLLKGEGRGYATGERSDDDQ
jgi:hypothetical protein